MSILTDAEINAYIANGELVTGANAGSVRGCSYNFRAGKIFTGGKKGTVTDWTTGKPHQPFMIDPGAMIWVRIREQVKLPNDVTATWWQTNGLSRQGIMLINMSIVDPGYQGPLACLFVNFGSVPVPIEENMVVARLLFHKSATPVGTPFSWSGDLAKYDNELLARAVAGASSFMQVAELATDLRTEKSRLLKEFEDDIKRDAPAWLRKTFVLAFGAIALLTIAVSAVPYVQGWLKPNLKGDVESIVDKRVDDRLIDRLAVVSPTPANDIRVLLRRIEGMEKELQGLRASHTNGPPTAP